MSKVSRRFWLSIRPPGNQDFKYSTASRVLDFVDPRSSVRVLLLPQNTLSGSEDMTGLEKISIAIINRSGTRSRWEGTEGCLYQANGDGASNLDRTCPLIYCSSSSVSSVDSLIPAHPFQKITVRFHLSCIRTGIKRQKTSR